MDTLQPQPIEDCISKAPTSAAAYVLANADLSYFYRGAARNLRERLKDHRAGRNSRTKSRRPLLVVHAEPCPTFEDALKREKYFKSGAGREWISRRLPNLGQTVPPTGDDSRPTADPP